MLLEIDIPGFGPVRLDHFVSDFTGTLSVDGLDFLLNPKRCRATLRLYRHPDNTEDSVKKRETTALSLPGLFGSIPEYPVFIQWNY